MHFQHTHLSKRLTKTLLLFASFLIVFFAVAPTSHAAVTPDDPGNFITTWNTENPGTSNDNQITIPGTGGGYNYELYWEDTASSTINGTTSLITSSSYTLTFPAPGIYEVQASGTFPRIYFDNSGDKDKILTVEQWGDIAWTSMSSAFNGASNLRIPATDAPDLNGVTRMNSMFRGASAFNDPINHWDVSHVTDMSRLFYAFDNPSSQFVPLAFNQPLDQWNVSNVTDMGSMFGGATNFNQPLNTWDVSNVTDMTFMFQFTSFNQPLDQWEVGNVLNMWELFFSTPFNQPINNWDTSNVIRMEAMFAANPFFNQPLDQWDTNSVTNMKAMFRGSTAFDRSLATWDISSVTSMDNMFTQVDSTPLPFIFSGATQAKRDDLDALYEPLPTGTIGLSTANQTATLESWATQAASSTIENIPLHIGLKQYTDPTALNTLESLGWTITEQYQADYRSGSNAILVGTSLQKPLNSGATTNAVEISPKDNCTFIQWSDGNTDNPRTDTLTDNLSVTAEVTCRSSSSGSSASGRAAALERQGNVEAAAAIRERFDLDDTTPADSESLEDTLERVKAVPLSLDTLDPVRDRETIKELIRVLLELVQALTLLMTQVSATTPE